MTKLPKTLRDKRDAFIKIRFDNPTQEQVRDLYNFNIGYDACFSDMSEAVQGLVEALEKRHEFSAAMIGQNTEMI